MKPLYKLFFIPLCLFFLSGCTASVAYLNDGIEKAAPTAKEHIKIYAERDMPRETAEIGYVSTHLTAFPNGDKVKETMRELAAQLGADAIIGFEMKDDGSAEGIAVKFKHAP